MSSPDWELLSPKNCLCRDRPLENDSTPPDASSLPQSEGDDSIDGQFSVKNVVLIRWNGGLSIADSVVFAIRSETERRNWRFIFDKCGFTYTDHAVIINEEVSAVQLLTRRP